MKSKILQEFKTNHSNLGLSDPILASMSEAISQYVKDETLIPAAVKAFAESLKPVQSETDRMRTEIAEWKKKAEQKPSGDEKKVETATEKSELPKEVSDFISEMKAEKESKIKQEKLTAVRREAKEELVKKGIKESLCDMYLNDVGFSEDLTKDSVVGNIEKKHNVFLSEISGQGGRVPNTTGGGATAVSEIKELMEKKKAQMISEKDYANKFKNS
jgi:hypothetical protein